MRILVKSIQGFGIVLGILFSYVGLWRLTHRNSLMYIAVLALVALPVALWRSVRFKTVALVLAGLAVSAALSPIDVLVQKTGRMDVSLLPGHFGISCEPNTACFGCVVYRHAPTMAIVVSY
jgi:ABC-type Fe3+-siderophore transport system permease subunit